MINVFKVGFSPVGTELYIIVITKDFIFTLKNAFISLLRISYSFKGRK